MRAVLLGVWVLLWCCVVQAQRFESAAEGANLVELYTSEGCSSCPPADAWLSTLAADPQLFGTLFPVAFHVDYWNQLGWPDRFSSGRYSERQRSYVRQGHVSQVYTPGLVVNGQEWRGWLRGQRRWQIAPVTAGVLLLDYQADQLEARYNATGRGRHALHLVRLGMGLHTEVKAGENSGRRLSHDFVVLDYHRRAPENGRWSLDLGAVPDKGQRRVALVAWVSLEANLQPLQVAGGFIDPEAQ
ncbi:DUF1223 domain-containing protein [Marinobacterium rhizophilum]|uniref:DUF1223 domain-containing protein n=1 Tax=Marinobacterium rhizophilum TaxID=420402 RepID=A0ABY5HQK8_9GAMM|nr:DUF1223 domain-containing protein [Marinobacterium rhizophilum]UTW13502.1 DUF1223 domain-containing protein [Marinobacterium rhizophilum]